MRATDLIAHKRDGGKLSEEQLFDFVMGYTRGEIPDYQAAALLMAIYLRGMDEDETAWLTRSMADSGKRLDLSGLPYALDKHSTGGVGDKTSLIVVPLLAAAGVPVCKMSGRGLGHTGGTLDKLEAIPGLTISLTPERMLEQTRTVGACLAGQTADLAPADGKLYALRDATATVASIPLIVASILSKKLAGGAPAFLFDVKVGGGALMKTRGEAETLARALVTGARANGRRAVALLTAMDQPLGRAVGNALEIAEALAQLAPAPSPGNDPRLRALCLTLAAEGLSLARSVDIDDARGEIIRVWESGEALKVFTALIEAQGGELERLPRAPVQAPIAATTTGFVRAIDARAVGELTVALGGGRARKEDAIDPAVGVVLDVAVGDRVAAGSRLATVHAGSDAAAEAACARLRAAFTLGHERVEPEPLLLGAVR